jgi:hypothetical protein
LSPSELGPLLTFVSLVALKDKMLLQTSFRNYFTSLEEVNNCANSNMMGFAKIMDPNVSTQQRIDYLTNDDDIVFLGANASREFQIFHSPRNLSGSVM